VKKIKTVLLILFSTIIVFSSIILFVYIINDDMYCRLTQTENISSLNFEEKPTITLILKKYLIEENALEATLSITYNNSAIFKQTKSNNVNFITTYSDGYHINPTGLVFKSKFSDNVNNQNFGYLNSGHESETFSIPIAPSVNGFPFDDLKLNHNISLYINNEYSKFNFKVQKRIPGRIFKIESDNKKIITLTRSKTEKVTVVISSIIFLFLTSLVLYGFIKSHQGLDTIEELLSIAGFLIAIAGFREIIGVSRINGVGTLEIIVILVPLTLLFIGMVYSFVKGKNKSNEKR